MGNGSEATLARELVALHDELDHRIARISASYNDQLACRQGCHECCCDDLTVFEVEALRIRTHQAQVLAEGRPHPPGKCAFLSNENHCRIYEDRPQVCRTQGLPLRWIEDDKEYRDICPLNEKAVDPVALAPDQCWELGPTETRLRGLQERLQEVESSRTARRRGALQRIALRDLFDRP